MVIEPAKTEAVPGPEAAVWLTSLIQDFIRSGENDLRHATKEPAFDEPLVGFSSGADKLYLDYKEHVGPFHYTPQEIFGLTFPADQAAPEELTVITWILPWTKAVKEDNRRENFYPAERWARGRIFGEEVNVKLRQRVVAALTDAGYRAVAPLLTSHFSVQKSDRFTLASTWSERHAAYAAGLGTFGLCDGLITPRGKAMRTGSVVTRLTVPATPRPYQGHREYCLFFTQGACKKCIARCPVGALSEAGHDKVKCHAHIRTAVTEHVKAAYKFDGYGCGLCQTGVPCESKIPTRRDVED
ncbi:MAG: epoxyqueuosine reductase [Thermodesulfobacteriota bacterium]